MPSVLQENFTQLSTLCAVKRCVAPLREVPIVCPTCRRASTLEAYCLDGYYSEEYGAWLMTCDECVRTHLR